MALDPELALVLLLSLLSILIAVDATPCSPNCLVSDDDQWACTN